LFFGLGFSEADRKAFIVGIPSGLAGKFPVCSEEESGDYSVYLSVAEAHSSKCCFWRDHAQKTTEGATPR